MTPEVVSVFAEHFNGEDCSALHSAFCLWEDQNTSGFGPTPGQIKPFLAQVEKLKRDSQRRAKRDQLNREHHDFRAVGLEDLRLQWGLVPAWRINSDGTAGWNWGGVENCKRVGSTLMFGQRVDLYARTSHLEAFKRYHALNKTQSDWRSATQHPAIESYVMTTTDKDSKGKETEVKRHYVRANASARAQILEAYQEQMAPRENSFGGYEASGTEMNAEWLKKYKASDHYKNAMSKIEAATGPLAVSLRRTLGKV